MDSRGRKGTQNQPDPVRPKPQLDRLDAAGYQRFLAWIGHDAVPQWQVRLDRYFQLRADGESRTVDASALASETLDRAAVKFREDSPAPPPDGPVAPYLYGVARRLWLETRRETLKASDTVVEAEIPVDPPNTRKGVLAQLVECFSTCMAGLSEDDRALIYDYYRGRVRTEGERKRIRQDIRRDAGVSGAALRIRLYRLKHKVIACLAKCPGGGIPPLTSRASHG